ncbi:DNA sulfur modification protein DndE [Oceanimonas pelagia]|uniref:DNA sulfur modification protein DndE n=1 Tax=Oceanimonas pelagia TaxID=3028314 RepID=A0AA50Q6V5_9GAMM|nr:DNA sulfur modification protein DndE [Oceanimonas pelagia]WMC09820.1 DNA sulfur modification protein DndE [Oceanimonas pelagia]
MLPNRMQLRQQTEEQLKRLKSFTGITPNVAARIAFFRSIESGLRYTGDQRKLDGNLVLDKITWLGDTVQVTELLLQLTYPDLDQKEMMKAWAFHVEDGIAALRNHKNLHDFSQAI